MFSRHVLLVTMLGAAVALPYFMSSEFRFGGKKAEKAGQAEEHRTADLHEAAAGLPQVSIGHEAAADRRRPASATQLSQPVSTATARGSVTSADLNQVMDFAVTPAWVLTQWPRVSASLAELDLQGYRVPLVTGTREDDLAGSLTYYFDQQQHVARITFTGTTGDPRRLIGLVTARFGFRADTSDDPAVVVYDVKWNNKPHSELRIRPVSIVRANEPRSRYQVELSVRRF